MANASLLRRPLVPADEHRLRRLLTENLSFVWRTLQRLGVPEAEIEDASQKVFMVLAEKLATVTPERERSFVFGTAMRVASHARRQVKRRREEDLQGALERADPGPGPEDAVQRREALSQLASILDVMPEAMRSTFLLFELEQLSMADIARMEAVPLGTVASRLRRAREIFAEQIRGLEGIAHGRSA